MATDTARLRALLESIKALLDLAAKKALTPPVPAMPLQLLQDVSDALPGLLDENKRLREALLAKSKWHVDIVINPETGEPEEAMNAKG